MQSDLKINKEKTVLIQQTRWCPHSHQTGWQKYHLKGSINMQGIMFDSKLNWSEQVAKVILKGNRSLIAIKIMRRFS
jgi:hypothetical protein